MPPTPSRLDVERGLGRPTRVPDDDDEGDESQALLANADHEDVDPVRSSTGEKHSPGSGTDDKPLSQGKSVGSSKKKLSGASYYAQLIGAFLVGVLCTAVMHVVIVQRCYKPATGPANSTANGLNIEAAPHVGSSEVHHFPPATPTNKFPELFPSNVGHGGATPTGAEAAIVATAPAWPMHTGAPHLVVPTKLIGSGKEKGAKSKFNMLEKWGNLSPWYSVGKGAFGLDSEPETPDTCRTTGLHFLHRHGARYPTEWSKYGGPAKLAKKLHDSTQDWTGSGLMIFLNDWSYKLGAEVLTPFGRQQLFDLGVTLRVKYGFLLQNFTESNTLPVFRTESQNRMLASAMNFAIGFFGWPYEDQYQQSITIEADGFNNTLSPYKTCPNANSSSKSQRAWWYVSQWTDKYLHKAQKRIGKEMEGFDLTIEDVYSMQQMCAYETVALGYSKFCELFTEEEWEGFNYALDLYFWYDSAFGAPTARALGIGWVQELVARLTHTPIAVHNSSTNGTLDDNTVTFPLDQSLYVDATHEVVVLNVITALNLTSFAEQGPLPHTHIPKDYKFHASEIAPFATNMQLQLLECTSVPGQQIRIIINDGVVPLTGIKGCPEQEDGMCPVDTFVEAMKEQIRDTDWNWVCHGDWDVPAGTEWNTTTGSPPRRGD